MFIKGVHYVEVASLFEFLILFQPSIRLAYLSLMSFSAENRSDLVDEWNVGYCVWDEDKPEEYEQNRTTDF